MEYGHARVSTDGQSVDAQVPVPSDATLARKVGGDPSRLADDSEAPGGLEGLGGSSELAEQIVGALGEGERGQGLIIA
jgi:hypothetical protein